MTYTEENLGFLQHSYKILLSLLENKAFFRKIEKIKIPKQTHVYFLYIKFLWLFCVIQIEQRKSYTVAKCLKFWW